VRKFMGWLYDTFLVPLHVHWLLTIYVL
jgi:hypothetical protein